MTERGEEKGREEKRGIEIEQEAWELREGVVTEMGCGER